MEPQTTAWIVAIIFLGLPILLVPAFHVLVTKEWNAYRELISLTLALVVMGIFIGFIIACGLAVLYVLLQQIGLGGIWTFHFEQIVFSDGLFGLAFLSVLVLSGVSAYLIPALRREDDIKQDAG